MALKALMIRKRINDKQKELESLRAKKAELEQREAELAQAIEEAETEEERTAVEEAITAFEAESRENEEATNTLDGEIAELETELEEEEKAQETEPEQEPEETTEKRNGEFTMNKRSFFGLTAQERDMFIARDDVKSFLGEVRTCIAEKRALTNVGLTVPTVMLDLLRENIEDYSKLYKHVFVRRIGGNGRAVIMGTIPEGVWTDCCGALNERDLAFYDMEFNCWKVGGYFAVCNAVLEDSDIDLASELLTALGQGIGLALDKAILYGTGSRMPLGVVTRLVQTAEPDDYSETARPWADLHTSNVTSVATTVKDSDLFKAIVNNSGSAKGAYSRGEKVWVMNEKTYTTLIANSMAVNSAGALVAGVNGTMPVVGGAIEVLSFIPDNVIIGGYFDLYSLAERAGEKFATSEHVKFLQDQTVFKGTARYDGAPAIAEAFVAIGINGVTPNATMTFATDSAN